MKQLALDIGLASGPTLSGFYAGPNEPVLRHLEPWVDDAPPLAGTGRMLCANLQQ